MTEPATTATAQRTSGKAIAALVVGIVSLIAFGLIAGVVAIILGIQARKDIEADSNLGGHGLATAGIALGVVGIVLWAFVMYFWFG